MKFTDGMEINVEGDYRVIRKSDGWYVVGHGTLEAVDSYAEGKAIVDELQDDLRRQAEEKAGWIK